MLNHELEKYTHKIKSFLIKSNNIGIVQLDLELNIIDCNIGFMRLFNPRKTPTGEQLNNYLELDRQDIRCDEELKIQSSRKSGMNAVNSCYLIQTDDGYLLLCERLLLTESRALEQMGSMNDDLVNMQRELVKKNRLLEKLKAELDARVVALETAANRIKHLEGIISICMYCKKIRNEHEAWEQLEKYITEHSDALFSHGICPACMEEHYPNIHQKRTD